MTDRPQLVNIGALELDLLQSQGVALALVGSLLERCSVVEQGEFARMMGLLAVITGETHERQGNILAIWAAMAGSAPLGDPAAPEDQSGGASRL